MDKPRTKFFENQYSIVCRISGSISVRTFQDLLLAISVMYFRNKKVFYEAYEG